ncbi:thioredoxin-like protein [Marinobacter pelagius]|nr:thioredoxin family protein [Marinobacter pelagius]RBP25333.1 thioredoxin-like protein [Marinobacter pelagius]
MKFTIYGSGCAKCKQLTTNAEEAAKALGLD